MSLDIPIIYVYFKPRIIIKHTKKEGQNGTKHIKVYILFDEKDVIKRKNRITI